jgi:hypothetical protein
MDSISVAVGRVLPPNTLTDGVPKVPKGALRASVTFGTLLVKESRKFIHRGENSVRPPFLSFIGPFF